MSLFAGSDSVSVSIVVSAFLAGVGLGCLIGSAVADRLKPQAAIRLYAICNVVIAGYAMITKYLFYDILFLEFSHLAVNRSVTLAVSFVSLLLPTVLMGLSLPLLSPVVTPAVSRAASSISLLYGINTVGAALGALVGGWFVVRHSGFEGALIFGATLNVIAALIAYPASQKDYRFAAGKTSQGIAALRSLRTTDWLWFLAVVASGFTAIALQLVWFRVIQTFYQSVAYTFAILLFAFLLFDGLGAIVGAAIARRVINPRLAFALCQGAIAMVGIGSVVLASHRVALHLPVTAPVYLGLMVCLVVAPGAFLIGFYFPLVQAGVQIDRSSLGARSGLIDFSIIMGNAAGGLITGLLLLHLIGTIGVLYVVGGIGLAFLLSQIVVARGRARLGVLVVSAALTMVIAGIPGTAQLYSGIMGIARPAVASAEDRTGVSLLVDHDGVITLYEKGHSQGYVQPLGARHMFLGAVGPLLHDNPRHVLIAGLGSASTAYGAGLATSVEKIVVVEIATSQVDALRQWTRGRSATVSTVLTSPRYEIVGDDVRRFLTITDQTFDIIEGDPLRATTSGSGLLYSIEYFQLVASKLNHGGLFVTWMPTPRVLAGVRTVFEHVVVIDGSYIVASNQPFHYDQEKIYRQAIANRHWIEASGTPLEAFLSILGQGYFSSIGEVQMMDGGEAAPVKEVSASTEYSASYGAKRVIEGSSETFWSSSRSIVPRGEFLEFTLGEPRTLSELRWRPFQDALSLGPATLALEGRTAGGNWVSLGSHSFSTDVSVEWQTVLLPATELVAVRMNMPSRFYGNPFQQFSGRAAAPPNRVNTDLFPRDEYHVDP